MTDTLDLTAETRALHALILPPDGQRRTPHTDELHAMLEPVHAAIVHVQDKLREIERATRAARRSETHAQGVAFFGMIENTTRAAETNIRATLQHLDALTRDCEQLDRYAREWDESNKSYPERMKAIEKGRSLPIPVATMTATSHPAAQS